MKRASQGLGNVMEALMCRRKQLHSTAGVIMDYPLYSWGPNYRVPGKEVYIDLYHKVCGELWGAGRIDDVIKATGISIMRCREVL